MMKYKVLIGILAVIFVVGVIGSWLVLSAPTKSEVRILSGGEELYRFDLTTAEDTTLEISQNGNTNIVEISDGRIKMKSANCSDQTCVNMGWLSSSAMPIVCLPHGIVIEFVDSEQDVDAVTR